MRLTQRVHQYLEAAVQEGDLAIDATAGNGHDSLKLAELVGPQGQVIAIDLQAQAIESTSARLQAAGLLDRCERIVGDHAHVLGKLAEHSAATASAITFNLGYLPGSDKQVQTLATSTLPALDAAWSLLKPEGMLLVTAYRGHAGGLEEAEAVAAWIQQHASNASLHEPDVTGDRIPPILWAAQKT